MHILHVETGRHLYGGALQVQYLMEGLNGRGSQNTLVCIKGSQIALKARSFARVYELPVIGELDLSFIFHLWRIIRKEQPDIVHVHSRRGADLWSGIAARMTKTRAILTRRVDNPEPLWFVRIKYRLYNRVITISKGIRRVLLSEGVSKNKMVCVPSGVDSKEYEKTCKKEWFYEEFDLEPSGKVIGVIAQFIARKGHRYVIEAAPDILKQFPEVRFLFFGQGPLREKLRRLCQEMGMAYKISFSGFRTDLRRILPCLDLVIHPATMEGLGVSLLQAAAAGVPIVATRVGGIPEIVHDGVNGYLVDVGNTQAIASAVLTLLHDPVKAKRLGQAGQELVGSRFSLEAMVAGNLCVYRELLRT